MVYDTSKLGLNDTMFAPCFSMPTMESYLRLVKARTFMANCDIIEMFLNFMLEPKVHPYAGVDLSQAFLEEASERGGKFNG